MSNPAVIHKESFKRSVWKNGLGFTDEIAIFPPESSLIRGDFLWRLSSARIEKASPFSVFPNHDRVLLVLKGAGLKLIHTFEEGGEDEAVEIPRLEPYEFPGDVPSRCELLDGPITDFSIFLRKGEVEPLVQIEELQEDERYHWEPEGKWNYAFAVNGHFEAVSETGAILMSEGNALSANSPLEFKALNHHSRLLLISLG